MQTRCLAIALVVVVAAAACDSRCPPPENGEPGCTMMPPQRHIDPPVKPTFTLYVSNQSFDLDPVDIRVTLDDKLAITGDFVVGNQHTWVKFDFGLPPGDHTLRASTADVNATLVVPFVMDDRKYGVLNFWYYAVSPDAPQPPQFTFNVSDDPPQFE